MSRLIFHVDVNSAFLSWEATRRVQNGEPDLRLIPSAIGGDQAQRRGVILAKSTPAKAFGIKTGEPVATALRKCPDLVLAKPDFSLYVASSRKFVAICEEFAPVVEKFSIDECFLDMTGTERVYPDPVEAAHRLKDTIRDRLGFTVNVGIGENKLCAKMAGDFKKPDLVHTLWPAEIPEKLWPLDVEELLSVGEATAAKLRRVGISTIGQLANCGEDTLCSLFGEKTGRHLHRSANGIDDSEVMAQREDAKGYSVSSTLERDVTDYAAADAILLAQSDVVASRMRADGAQAWCVAVSIRTSDFVNRSHQKKLAAATDITGEISREVRALLRELWNGKTPLRLLGVALTDIDRSGSEQLTLFP
ncbi:MAG: DNA polymerase IV, partial [Ruminococcaceae bacterium]|nr:DNA polymerase IV [Oscillospiraceae bacterium]